MGKKVNSLLIYSIVMLFCCSDTSWCYHKSREALLYWKPFETELPFKQIWHIICTTLTRVSTYVGDSKSLRNEYESVVWVRPPYPKSLIQYSILELDSFKKKVLKDEKLLQGEFTRLEQIDISDEPKALVFHQPPWVIGK